MTRLRVLGWVAVGVGVSGLLLACSKPEPSVREEEPALAPASASAAVADTLPSASAEADQQEGETAESLSEPNTAVMEDDIPTEEDFEDEAELRISEANLESALDELEREIAD